MNEKLFNLIQWKLQWHDGEEDWRGFIAGEEICRVFLGSWFYYPTDECDSCESDEEGKIICLELWTEQISRWN
jgi:hypothetical protein